MENWGAKSHGGMRWEKALNLEEAIEYAAAGVAGISMAKVRSEGVDTIHPAVGEKQREVGQRAGSAVGEEQAKEGGMSPLIAECWSPGLPTTLPPVPIAKQRIAGYRVIEIINSGSFGDVYKAVKNSSGELFAIKVMQKCRIPNEVRGFSRKNACFHWLDKGFSREVECFHGSDRRFSRVFPTARLG